MKKWFSILLSALFLFTACSPAQNPAVFSRGTVSGQTYRNDFAGLTVTLPEGWVFFSDEERENTYAGFDAYDENGDFITCCDAGAWKESGASLMITYENAAVLYGEAFSVEDYLSAAKESLAAQFSEAYGDVSVERLEADLAGKTVPYLSVPLSVGDLRLYDNLLAQKVGDYIVSVSFCVFSEAERDEVLAGVAFS